MIRLRKAMLVLVSLCVWLVINGQSQAKELPGSDATLVQLVIQLGHSDFVTSAVFAPDGRTILTTSSDRTARLWETATGRELRQFAGHTREVTYAVFSSDGRSILTASGDHTARLWDTATGQELRQVAGHSGAVTSAVFAPDGLTILTASGDHTARLWDVATGQELRRLEGHTEYVRSAVFAPDGLTILTASGDHTARLWDTATGQELRRVGGHTGAVTCAVFASDASAILTASYDHTARLWEVTMEQELLRFAGHTSEVTSAVFAPDGRTILTASWDRTARLWDAATGQELRRFAGHTDGVNSVVFASDGRTILTSSWDYTVRLWDVATGQELRRFAGHTDGVNSAVFAPNGRAILTAGWDGTSRLWDVQTGEELARLVSFTDGTWAVVDREGRFDGSNGGDLGALHWVMGLEWISLNQLKDRYYEPGLLAKKLGFNPDPLRPVSTFTAPALYPEVTLNQPSVTDPVLRVTLTNRGGGIGRVMVTMNGKEMTADARPRGADPTASSLTVELPLTVYQRWLKAGNKNSIAVRAYNAEGYLVSRAAEVVYEAPGESTPPDIALRAVIVGVSDYAGDQLDLRYAAKDAEDMAKAVELGGRRLFGADHVHIRLLTTTQADPLTRPTKGNIKAAFEALGEAKPDDILFVYFSGHGVAVRDVYHYPTQEAHTTNLEDPAVRAERSVSSEEIAQWLKQSPATQRQVLVLDTCAAGAAAKSLVEHRNVPADQIRALERLKDRMGVHVLMGSAADRVSWEATQFEQGLLTHALLRGMKGVALRDDSYIDVSRLFNYVADEVPKLAAQVGGIQRPHIATPRATNVESFDIGQLTNADRNAIPLRNPKPLLLRPTLLNGQSAFDDLSLEPKLRARLREESFARTRGRETPVVFLEADEFPGAIKPSGLYLVEGGRLRAIIVLRRDDITKEIQVEGARTDLEGFIEKTAQAVTRAVDGWK